MIDESNEGQLLICDPPTDHIEAQPRRTPVIPAHFQNSIISSTLGHRDPVISEDQQRNILLYPLIDTILLELRRRFTTVNNKVLSSISTLQPDHAHFLDPEMLHPLADHLYIDHPVLKHELTVIKRMFATKKFKNIFDVIDELQPMKNAFPFTMDLLLGGITFPVSTITCECSFSKLKMIKTTARNTISDSRLSDLAVLSVERDIPID